MNQSQIREFNIRKVLDVSQALFLKNGVENTTVSSIAKECGLAPTSVYRYFENKRNLARAVWHDSLMTFYNEYYMPEHRKATEELDTGFEKFKACMGVYYRLYRENPEWLEYTREMFQLASKDREGGSREENVEFWGDFFKEIPAPTLNALKDGVSDGSIRPDINVFEVYQLVTNIYTGMRTYEIFVPDMTALDIIRFTSDIISHYIRNDINIK